MSEAQHDHRTAERRVRDERIAAEPALPPIAGAANLAIEPVESHLTRARRRPVALEGVVENGVVRPLDPSVRLPEHARVIIVAPEAA